MSGAGREHAPKGGGYERRDVSVPLVIWFAIGLAVFTVGALVAMSWLLNTLAGQRGALAPDLPAAITVQRPRAPDSLQVRSRVLLQELREHERMMLNEYGWVSREAGVVHIPIDRAMDLLLERGLPVRDEETVHEVE